MKTRVDLQVTKTTDSSIIINATDDISKACLTTIFGTDDSALLLVVGDRGGRVTTTFEAKDISNHYKVPILESVIESHLTNGNYPPNVQDIISNSSHENNYQSVESALSRLVAIESNDVTAGSFISIDETQHIAAVGHFTKDYSVARSTDCILRDAKVIATNIKKINEARNDTTCYSPFAITEAVKGIASAVLEPVLYGISDHEILLLLKDEIGKAATEVVTERINDKLPWE